MRRVPISEIENDFEKQFAWGDDERHLYHPNQRKSAVLSLAIRTEVVLELLQTYVKPGLRVGDFACAQGNFGLKAAEMGYEVVAVDIHPDFLKYARKKHTHGNFETKQANLLEFQDPKPFDAIILGEVIEHVAEPEKLLSAVAKNLKPGGFLILTTPNGNEFGQMLPTFSQVTDITELIPRQFHWGDHLFLYTDDELKNLFGRVGLDWIKCEKINSSYVSQIKGARYLMPLTLLKRLERMTRKFKKKGKDSTNHLVAVGKRAF